MPLIGEGNYGCVFSPPLECNSKRKYKGAVGKVFSSFPEYESESKISNIIANLDPNNEFSLPLLDGCKVNSFKNSDGVDKCVLLSNDTIKHNHTSYSQLIYKNGGRSLKQLLSIKGSVPKLKKIMKAMRPIFVGVKKLSDVGYVHQDIKPHNILYDNNRLYLIDYGILSHAKNIYHKKNRYILSYDYPYYPPEYKLYTGKGDLNELYIRVSRNFNFGFEIAGRNVDLLEVIKSLGIDMKEGLTNILSKKTSCFVPGKVDIYSLGIVILELFIWSGLHIKTYKRNSPNKQFQERMISLLRGMIEFDVSKRYNIDEAITAFDNLFA